MSQHDVEDLVEESVRAVLNGGADTQQQRDVIAQLYFVQSWFDTSDTFGRLRDELAAIKFDRNAIPAAADILTLIPEFIAIVPENDRQYLLNQWLAFLGKNISEATLAEDWSSSFADFSIDPRAIALRELAQSLEAHKFKGRGAFKLRAWKNYVLSLRVSGERDLQDYYIIRFLLDLNTPLDRITAAYQKQRQKNDIIATGALTRLGEIVAERDGFTFISHEKVRMSQKWLFEIESLVQPTNARFYFSIEHEMDLSILSAKILVSSNTLERWQNVNHESELYHFSHSYFQLLSRKVINEDNSIHHWGGWKCNGWDSEKLLRKRLDSMLSHWQRTKPVFKFHSMPLEQRLDESNIVALESDRKKLRDKYGFFVTDIALMFAYACRSWEQGEKPDALIAQIREQLTHVHDQYDLKPAWNTALERLETGIAYPVGHAPFPYRYIE